MAADPVEARFSMGRVTRCLLISMLFLTGCPKPDDCTPNETRCYLNRAQICGSDQRWRTFMDCEELGGTMIDWTCCLQEGDGTIPAGHTCLERCPGEE